MTTCPLCGKKVPAGSLVWCEELKEMARGHCYVLTPGDIVWPEEEENLDDAR